MGPIGLTSDVLVFQSRSNAHALPIPIAMRVGRKSQENILSQPRRQVDQFGSRQLDLSGKVSYMYRINEPLQATDANQFEIRSYFAGGEQARSGHSNIE